MNKVKIERTNGVFSFTMNGSVHADTLAECYNNFKKKPLCYIDTTYHISDDGLKITAQSGNIDGNYKPS